MIIEKIKYYLKIFLINFFFLYSLLYLIELAINFKKDKLFKNTRLYYLNSLQGKDPNNKIYLNYGVYKLLDKKQNILPLSGYENSTILLCLDENNQPVFYFSDKHGFNNSINKENDFLLIGDSYVQGMCVHNKDNLNAQFEKFSYKTNALAVGGNGPLLELATFKEYKDYYNYKSVILFITPSNDFLDLSKEIKNSILLNYLNNKDFTQNLGNEENKKIKISILDSFFGNKTQRLWNDFLSVYHFNLKSLINSLENLYKNKKNQKINYEYLLNKEIDIYFIKILNEFINIIEKDKKKLYVVFNSVNPDILFPKSDDIHNLKSLLLNEKLGQIKKLLISKGISYFDFNEYILNRYNKNNISTMFKRIDDHWDHYTEKGFYEITEQIYINLLR